MKTINLIINICIIITLILILTGCTDHETERARELFEYNNRAVAIACTGKSGTEYEECYRDMHSYNNKNESVYEINVIHLGK